MATFFEKILRTGEGRTLKKLQGLTDQINAWEKGFTELSDAELREETDRFRERLADGATLDDLLPEAFAAVREASRRTLGQRHFDVQLMGGANLHMGNISEMKTGEGKTLVATLPAYLNALSGDGVHVVTVNDYLASYQSELMGRVFRMLGMTTGTITTGLTPDQRRVQYAADITYGTNNEFGFDYLRDNMAWTTEELVQRGHNFAIVDEVDSILIDEARTPLIISGPSGGDAIKWYGEFAKLVRRLSAGEEGEGDYEVDEKKRTVGILEPGIEKVEDYLGIENLYESLNTPLIQFLNNAIRAKELFKRDKDYVVMGGEVLIVDEHTGRVLPGRRYNEGMHQAIEAKEGVEIKAENQTLATITLQNYFRLYKKLSGMTGTAETEAAEFYSTYKIGVVPIPTNRSMVRIDQTDLVYKNEVSKFAAVVQDIVERHATGQPVLVGTTSVEKSEYLSKALRKQGVPHEVLNAKQHEREAAVVAMAGRKGAVTVATNMAGRGTDIMLGGNAEFIAITELAKQGLSPEDTPDEYEAAWPEALENAKEAVAAEHEEVTELGGLYVLGTERHESRRIDNQLRGRSGRQGDPGESRFYLSLTDDLMRLFNSGMAERLMAGSIPDDVPMESKVVARAIQSAQTQVEARNFEIRKNVLKYDDVLSRQREVIYAERRRVLEGEDMAEQVQSFITDTITGIVDAATAEGAPHEWNLDVLWTELKTVYPISITIDDIEEEAGSRDLITRQMLTREILSDARVAYASREEAIGEENLRQLERRVVLSVLDRKWREHLYEMDYLKEGIGLRAMAQRDPLIEYQREGYMLFEVLTESIREESVSYLFNLEVKVQTAPEVAVPDAPAGEVVTTGPGEDGEPEVVDETPQASTSDVPVVEKAAAPVLVAKGLDGPRRQVPLQYSSGSESASGAPATAQRTQADTPGGDGQEFPGASPNKPCPCGSGKKYKMCHGRGRAEA